MALGFTRPQVFYATPCMLPFKATEETTTVTRATRGNVSETSPRRGGCNNKKVEGKCRRRDEKLQGQRKNAPLDDFTLRIETPNPPCCGCTYIYLPPPVA